MKLFSRLAVASLLAGAAAVSTVTLSTPAHAEGSAPTKVAVVDVQRAVMQNTGQLVGSITIRVPSSGKSTVIANIPLGLFIPAGVTVDVDGTLPQKLELQTCDRNGCYASGALPANVIAAMGKGKKLNVVFQSLSKQPVTLPMSLAGFQGAYDKTKMTNG